MDESLETMRDERSKGYEDTSREEASSSEIDPRFGTGSEQSLFNRFLSDNTLQEQELFALDFNYTNFDEGIDATMTLHECCTLTSELPSNTRTLIYSSRQRCSPKPASVPEPYIQLVGITRFWSLG